MESGKSATERGGSWRFNEIVITLGVNRDERSIIVIAKDCIATIRGIKTVKQRLQSFWFLKFAVADEIACKSDEVWFKCFALIDKFIKECFRSVGVKMQIADLQYFKSI